jgi:hypothetical protein
MHCLFKVFLNSQTRVVSYSAVNHLKCLESWFFDFMREREKKTLIFNTFMALYEQKIS